MDIITQAGIKMQISRVERTNRSARKTYDRLSHIYDWLAGSSETCFMRLGLELLGVGSGDIALEIGCGTGKALVQLCHQVGNDRKVYALDLSRGMLRKSRSRLASARLEEQVCLMEGDGGSLPFKSGAFSAIFICFTLELFDTPDISLVLQECKRVLMPGGRLGVVALLRTDPPGTPVRLYEWFHRHFPSYVDCRPINAREIIEKAGFSIANRQVRNMWGLPVELLTAVKT